LDYTSLYKLIEYLTIKHNILYKVRSIIPDSSNRNSTGFIL
jgi:hypothetical protein